MIKINQIVNKAKKSSVFILIGLILFFLSSVITIAQGGGILKSFYQNTEWGHKSQMLEKLHRLSSGVNIAVFTDLFGSPTFRTRMENKDMYEYVFIDKFCYIQAITDLDDSVLAYSVTTKDKDFNPSFVIPLYEGNFNGDKVVTKDVSVKVILGKTKFSELEKPGGVISNLGAHDFYYSEKFWYGNPGLYQSYYFSQNEMGYSEMSDVIKDFEFHNSENVKDPIDPEQDDVKIFRENTVINTFTVTAPLAGFNNDRFSEVQFGPNKYQVRVIND